MGDAYDRTLMRLSSAEDDKLEPILAKLLPLVFDDLLTATDAAARPKIINILNHALTRAKGNPALQLPALGIAERWFSGKLVGSAGAAFFRNLSLIFMDLALPRLAPDAQVELALYTLKNFDKLLPGADQVAMFLAALPGLGQIATERYRIEKVAQCIQTIKEKPLGDAGLKAFFRAATDFLIIPCGAAEAPSVGGLASASWSHWKGRLKKKPVADMIKMKTELLTWLGSLGAEPPAALIYLPSLAAIVENYDAVCSIAEVNVKRIDAELDLAEDMLLLSSLTCMVLTSPPPGHETPADNSFKVESKANVPTKLRHKVLVLLQRARGIGNKSIVPYAVHLIRQSLREHESVQTAALQLAIFMAEQIDPDVLESASAAILEEVEAVFWPGGGVLTMGPATPLAFRCYGVFTKQLAEQPNGEGRVLALKAAPRMLTLLAANERAAQDILEALTGLVACMRGATEAEWRGFVPLLDRLVASPKAVVRREVLRWATSLFPTTAPEGRYYALRLFGDSDPDIARAADTALSSGKRDIPPFAGMCDFLASRALEGAKDQAAGRLDAHMEGLAAKPATLPSLSGAFTRRELVQSVSFLLQLAEAEGLHNAGTPSACSPHAAKKPRLSQDAADENAGTVSSGAVEAFLALLDYLLLDVMEGGSAAMTDIVADGATCIELGLQGLLLAATLAGSYPLLLRGVMQRAELVLFSGGSGTLFREGGSAASRTRRIGAEVAGTICKQFSQDAGDPTDKWLVALDAAMDAPPGNAQRAGAVLAVCEVLRSRPEHERGVALCQKALRLLDPGIESDPAIITATCDGLRRLSEQQRLVWKAVEATDDAGKVAVRQQLLNRLYELAKSVKGDIKDTEISTSARELIQASWRLLGQLAAWGGDESAECLDRLISIGKDSPGEEATAAIGLALAAATTDPTAPYGQPATAQMEILINRLLDMVTESVEEASAPNKPLDEEAKAKMKELEAQRRSGTVWLAVLVRRIMVRGTTSGWLAKWIEPLCRAFVRVTADTSLFHADVGLKALCFLYSICPVDGRGELMKTMFASFSNRTWVSNMFVGNPDTQTRRDAKKKEEAAGPDSYKITAKERQDAMKDLIFICRELHHPPLFVALLDQPSAVVWTTSIFREALDLQSPCFQDDMKEHLCPVVLRQQLFPPFFHPTPAVRQAIVALSANYFSCETPQRLMEKFPDDWPQVRENVVASLGSARVSTRQASISASLVLFRGKAWPEVRPVFEDFWAVGIKLMDDMEPLIEAAIKPLVRMMRNLTLRVCDTKVTPLRQVEEAIPVVIPMLLKYAETYKHAQPMCFEVLQDLIKAVQGTNLLSAFVQDLIPPLMVSLSMMENSQLQYYQFHVDAASEGKGKEFESARVQHSRDSASNKLLRALVPLLTPENAEDLAPRTRDLLRHGVGMNTRVGVCDFWAVVCAERSVAVPFDGKVANMMLRASSGALLDGSETVRKAAASCFASFARRNPPQELTKVVFERLLSKDKDHRTDDAQRDSFRVGLARALEAVCRRCTDGTIESQLKAAIAAKAFGLRYSDEPDVKSGWENLWSEMCPTISGGIEKYRSEICKELASAFEDSISRTEKITMSKAISALCVQLEKQLPRPKFSEEASILSLHKSVLTAVQSLPIFDGLGTLVKALADLAALIHRRKRGDEAVAGDPATESSTGLTLVLSFCSRGSLADRALSSKSALEVMSASRLWCPLADFEKLYATSAKQVDEMELEVEKEEREPGEPVPKRHRGKTQSAAEDLLIGTLDFWTSALEQCRREVEDDGDLEPPEEADFVAFVRASLAEFGPGSLAMRIAIVRFWKRVFTHFAAEKVAVLGLLPKDLWAQLADAIQNATLDQRSERLRRPTLEFAASLAKDATAGGGRDALKHALAAAVEAEAGSPQPRVVALEAWLAKLDPHTAEQEAAAVSSLKALA